MPNEFSEAGAPHTALFVKVRQLLNQTPFRPFRVVTTSGRSYDVPTVDHAAVTPISRFIHITPDEGGDIEIHALHIASIEPLRPRRRRPAA